MADATVDQVRRYILDGSDDDLQRLIIAHEPLASPPPRSLPYLGALATYWRLLHEVMERAGVPRGTVERLPRSARAAGLDVVEADGFFATQDPELGFEIHAGSLAAARGTPRNAHRGGPRPDQPDLPHDRARRRHRHAPGHRFTALPGHQRRRLGRRTRWPPH